MDFIPVISCKNCSQPIWLPPPVQSETSPSQIPWRWGNRSLNVACLSCNEAFEYLAVDCHWDQLEPLQIANAREMAAYQLSVPCGRKPCAGRMHILAIKRRERHASSGGEIAGLVSVRDIPCERGHTNSGRLSDPSDSGDFGVIVELRDF